MAEPARRRKRPAGVPRYDPTAVERAYAEYRARRQARLHRIRARRNARIRFTVIIVTLLALAIVIGIAVWHEIQRLFGL